MAEVKAKTHRERAERAAVTWLNVDNRDEPLTTVIARETFPAELVQAAKELLELRFVNLPKRTELRIERRMKAVLDLYEKEAPE